MTDKEEQEDQPLNLTALKHEMEANAELENRVVTELRYRRLLSTRTHRPSIFRIVSSIAACIAIFVGGMFFQKYFARADAAAPAPSMSDSTYVLFLLEDSEYRSARGEKEQQDRISAYRNWAVDLRQKGVPISGTKLQNYKNLLGKIQNKNDDNKITGYFLFDAPSPAQALEIARKCPHLQYGGRIEVRRVHPV